jgi:type I restriction enzyme S subunit
VTVKHLSAKQVQSVEMPLPPLPEQRRIVDLLSRAEGIVRLRREAERKATELIPALFLDMFGDPATNPKGWDEHRLGDIAEVVSGVTKGRKFGDRQTVEVPYLRVANVQAGRLDLSEMKTIEVFPKEVAQLALQHGDVMLTEGGDFDKLGRGALWEHDIPNCIHQNHVFRVRLNQALARPEFFVIYLQASKAREYFLRSAKRTTNLASINMTQLRALPVVLPPMGTQTKFVERFEAARSIQTQQSTATAKAQAAFDALLAKCFDQGPQTCLT